MDVCNKCLGLCTGCLFWCSVYLNISVAHTVGIVSEELVLNRRFCKSGHLGIDKYFFKKEPSTILPTLLNMGVSFK